MGGPRARGLEGADGNVGGGESQLLSQSLALGFVAPAASVSPNQLADLGGTQDAAQPANRAAIAANQALPNDDVTVIGVGPDQRRRVVACKHATNRGGGVQGGGYPRSSRSRRWVLIAGVLGEDLGKDLRLVGGAFRATRAANRGRGGGLHAACFTIVSVGRPSGRAVGFPEIR